MINYLSLNIYNILAFRIYIYDHHLNFSSSLFHITRVVPLSLLALKSCCHYFSLNRTPIDLYQPESVKNILEVLFKGTIPEEACNIVGQSKRDNLTSVSVKSFKQPNYKNGQCMDMQHIFRKHVKPKKQHEIRQLGQVVSFYFCQCYKSNCAKR